MEVITLTTPGLGDNSFLLIDEGLATAIDPQRDIERFLRVVEERGARLVLVAETHLHNDYVSGGLGLAGVTGAEMVLPAGAGAAFPYRPAFHTEPIEVGSLVLRPLHTPGHTPEHVAYLVEEGGRPVAVFSGGSLLVGAAGRSDLLGPERSQSLGPLQYGSVRRLAALPPAVGLYPTHGAGSFCTASMAGVTTSTIGAELDTNPVLGHLDAESFVAAQTAALQPYPAYYAHMGPANLAGPAPLPAATVPIVDATRLASLVRAGTAVVDARSKQHFAEGRLPGSWGIELGSDFVTWTGWLLPFDGEIVLVVDAPSDVEEARVGLARIGFEHIVGAKVGLDDWEGDPALVGHETTTARGFLALDDPGPQVLDVRSPAEWEESHLPGSIHCYLPDLLAGTPEAIDPRRPVYVGCTTGHRASVAAGLLADRGYRPVVMTGASLLGVVQLLSLAPSP
jgi:glyoxylase-like metal-dependent hydrolase (beta-lactamase superfamily II)/rhodanese-related sulfurtransferase